MNLLLRLLSTLTRAFLPLRRAYEVHQGACFTKALLQNVFFQHNITYIHVTLNSTDYVNTSMIDSQD